MIRSEFPRALCLFAGLLLVGCSSSGEETGADIPQPGPVTQQRKAPATSGAQPTLGRVVDESRRRRAVIRQLETIFQNPRP